MTSPRKKFPEEYWQVRVESWEILMFRAETWDEKEKENEEVTGKAHYLVILPLKPTVSGEWLNIMYLNNKKLYSVNLVPQMKNQPVLVGKLFSS